MKKAFLIVILFLVASCTEANRKTTIAAIIGGLVGGGVGAIAGHQSDHDGAGVAIGAAAGVGIGALIGQALENQSGPNYADNSISQDRAFYPTTNDDSLNNNSGFSQYSYNLDTLNSDLKNTAGYFGAINGGTYSDYDNNLLNYVATGQARGYLGALNNDPRVAGTIVANNNNTNPINKGLYASNIYTGGSYAGRSYAGADGNQGGVIPNVVNARNVEYPKASYSWDNPSNTVTETTLYNQVSNNNALNNDLSNDCVVAKDEITKANKTEVLADKLFHFRRALRLCPDSADYHNGLGEVYLVLNRKNDAEFEFKEALRLNPSLYVAKKNLNMINNSY